MIPSETKSTIKTIISITLLSVILVFLTFNFFIEFSAFAVALLKAIISFTFFWAIDKYAVPEVDTMKELKNGNVAYALFLIAISFVVGTAILSV